MFAFLLAAGLCHAFGVRPEVGISRATKIVRLGEKVAGAASSDASNSVQLLQAAAGIVQSILAESGNATEHMSDEDQVLLKAVIPLIAKTIYGSMNSSHHADETAISRAITDVGQCNLDYPARIAEGGDLFNLLTTAKKYQKTLDLLQDDVDVKTAANATTWKALQTHISWIGASPECGTVPSEPIKDRFDLFFEESQYVIWYLAKQAAYEPVREAFEDADAALTAALQAYAVGWTNRETAYCAMRDEFEAGCKLFNSCFDKTSKAYLNDLVPVLKEDMHARMAAYKAGETIIAQIEFLLGLSTESEPPTDIDTSLYELQFPPLPVQETCETEVLDSDIWEPVPNCKRAQLMNGCSQDNTQLVGWGIPREEWASKTAGETQCYDEKTGKATRHIDGNGQAVWSPVNAHQQCTTPNGNRLFPGDKPSHDFFESKAICERAGLRLCSTQQEVNSACNTGCWYNAINVWVEEMDFSVR